MTKLPMQITVADGDIVLEKREPGGLIEIMIKNSEGNFESVFLDTEVANEFSEAFVKLQNDGEE